MTKEKVLLYNLFVSTKGGPMVCPIKGDKGSLAQFGICSFGHDGDQGKCTGMAVYANTARYIDWVKKMAED